MTTKVLPFNPIIKGKQSSNSVAQEMEEMINNQVADGWKFHNFYTSETVVAGSNGCFGIGAKATVVINLGFLVFHK